MKRQTLIEFTGHGSGHVAWNAPTCNLVLNGETVFKLHMNSEVALDKIKIIDPETSEFTDEADNYSVDGLQWIDDQAYIFIIRTGTSPMFSKVINLLLNERMEFHVYNMDTVIDATTFNKFSHMLPDGIEFGDDFRVIYVITNDIPWLVYDYDTNTLEDLYKEIVSL
jgi:hypothetical protein